MLDVRFCEEPDIERLATPAKSVDNDPKRPFDAITLDQLFMCSLTQFGML
jgi:hypothetical protein